MTTPDGDGEVVEVFTGDTLEEAMAAAVAALGPELTVRRARKVRSGVRGLLGRDRYEVLAVPPEGAALPRPARADDDAVGSALEALLEAADEREAGGPAARPVARPAADRPVAARPTADDLPPPLRRPAPGPPAPLPPAPRSGGSPLRRLRAAEPTPEEPPARRPDPVEPVFQELLAREEPAPEPVRRRRALGRSAERAPHPDPTVADHEPAAAAPPAPAPEAEREEAPEPAPRRAAPAKAAPARPAAKKAAPVRGRRTRPAGWSHDALSALGVPDPVLAALPEQAPGDDLAWVVALTAAIEATVPAPAEPDERTPVVVSGHGLAGAVAVLDAGCRGLSPGTITHAGRTAAATATELALVLRHHVTGGA